MPIIAELLRSYGGSLLLDPPASGATLWLWLDRPWRWDSAQS